MAIDNTHSYLG